MRVYVLGDSISVHYGSHLQAALADWADYARKGGPDASGTDWENPTDANGGDSRRVVDFLRTNLPAINADWLLLNCGLHDLRVNRNTGLHQVPLSVYRSHLATAITLIRDADIRPVWITTTRFHEAHHNQFDLPYLRFDHDAIAYHAAALDVMTAHAVPVIPLHALDPSPAPSVFVDHVHYTPARRAAQAACIHSHLRRIIDAA